MTTLTPFFNQYRSYANRPQAQIPCLTLVHGWGAHSLVWDQLMPALLEYFRVTVVDLPGMGNSPIPNDPYTLSLLSEQVALVMPERTHLLGWSLGGLVSLTLAEQFPDRVLSVATIATNPCFCRKDDWPTAAPEALFSQFGELLKEDNNGTLIRFMALNCNGGAELQTDLKMLKDVLHFCGLPAPRALREGLKIFQQTDLRSLLASLKQPLLALLSEQDAIVPVAVAEPMRKLTTRITVETLADVGHLPFLTGHQAVARRLVHFWRQNGVV